MSERLLRDVFVLLDACLGAGATDTLEAFASALVDRLCAHTGAATGLLLVHEPSTGQVLALPAHRAVLVGVGLDAVARFHAALARESAAVVPAGAGFAQALSVPAPPDAVLELYGRDTTRFDDRTAQVLRTLAPWLAARLRAASRDQRARIDGEQAGAARQQLEALVSSLPGVVWRFDARDQPTFVSARATDLLGTAGPFTAASGPASHPRERGLSPADRARIADEIQAAARARLTDVTLGYRYTHGTTRHLLDLEERLALAYDARGELTSATGFVTDVTAARAAHRHIEELSAQRTADARADALRVDAARASRVKSEFLNLLSHELRAPLFPIIALSDLLLRTDDARVHAHEWREQVRMINGAGKQMLQLVGDLLDISRVDANRARPNPGPIALSHFVSVLTSRGQERARARGTPLTVELAPTPLGTDIYTDRSVLERIATALVAHTIENLDSTEVRVEVLPGTDSIVIRVTAKAPAPAQLPDDVDDVFDPFWERPAEARAESRGQGLALTLVRRLATGYGGQARASIEPDRRIFEASLPCAYPGPPRPFARLPRAIFASGELGAVFGSALWAQSLGADVRIVGSAAEVVDELKKATPDLLFVDARLPGLRVIEELLRAERGGGNYRPRVVALVRSSEPFAVSSAVADEIMPLPVTRERMATTLARF